MTIGIQLVIRIIALKDDYSILENIMEDKNVLHNIGNMFGIILNLNVDKIEWTANNFIFLIAHSIEFIDSSIKSYNRLKG